MAKKDIPVDYDDPRCSRCKKNVDAGQGIQDSTNPEFNYRYCWVCWSQKCEEDDAKFEKRNKQEM